MTYAYMYGYCFKMLQFIERNEKDKLSELSRWGLENTLKKCAEFDAQIAKELKGEKT